MGDSQDGLYLQQRAGLPSHDPNLFGHQRWLEQSLAELIFSPGTLVAVACDASHLQLGSLPDEYSGRLGRYLDGRVKVTVGGLEALVEFLPLCSAQFGNGDSTTLNESNNRVEFVKLERLSLRGPLSNGEHRDWSME